MPPYLYHSRRTLYIVLLGALCIATAQAEHYRVYLLGGQSNGNGRGDAAELSAAPLDVLGLDAPQTNVRLYWHKTQSTPNGNLPQNTWLDLQPDTGHGVNSPSSHAVEFGPELTFGRDMANNDPSVNIAIIKYTHGGTNLHTQWSASGVRYASFLSTVQGGLAALTAAGDTYEIGGMIWVQGESDTGAANAGNYEANLRNLIERVRDDVFGGAEPGGYTLPFIISGISDSQYTDITTVGSGSYTVRQAQETVAATERQAAFVDTDGLPTYSNGAIHFDATAQIAIGEGCAAQMLALESMDADRDGLLLSEETSLGTDPLLNDSDCDGQPDGLEAAAGTDPLDGASFFGLEQGDVVNGQITLTWPSLPGNVYDIEWSTDLEIWNMAAAGYPAADPLTATTWSGAVSDLVSGPGGSDALALYDAQTALNGDFNTTAFDSVDADSASTSSRLAQGGSLTGGGAGLFILNRAQDTVYFNGHSDSGWPGFNFGGVNAVDQAAAAAAGDHFSFTVGSGQDVCYDSLSFFSNQFGTTGKVDISYAIGAAAEVFIVQGLVPAPSNVPVTVESIDFADFTTNETVTWTFYLYASGAENYGIRFDDIKLSSCTSSTGPGLATVIANFPFTGPPWAAQKESDFAIFAANAPSVDTDADSVVSVLSNNGYTAGGYSSFYIRDIDGGTVGSADANDFVIFSTSATPGVGLNIGGADAASPTNYISFTVTPVADPVTYTELTLFSGANAANDSYDIELRAWDGAVETVLGSITRQSGSTSNSPVASDSIDFADFSSAGAIEFRLYGYNVNSSAGGIRIDDLVLLGDVTPIPSVDISRLFFRIGLGP